MVKKTKVLFPKQTMYKRMLRFVVNEQTKRLCDYAKNELYEMIVSRDFNSRTFNLVDSYVWAVYYNKKERGHGFVGGKMAHGESILHEWGKKVNQVPVNGRRLAQEFLTKFKATRAIENGWAIVWAACAPYSVYLDPAAGASRTNRFFVISQRYDHIRGVLEPKCRVEFETQR